MFLKKNKGVPRNSLLLSSPVPRNSGPYSLDHQKYFSLFPFLRTKYLICAQAWSAFVKKPFVKLRPAYFVKLVFAYVVNGAKIKLTAKSRDTEHLRFKDTKRIMSPETFPDFREINCNTNCLLTWLGPYCDDLGPIFPSTARASSVSKLFIKWHSVSDSKMPFRWLALKHVRL